MVVVVSCDMLGWVVGSSSGVATGCVPMTWHVTGVVRGLVEGGTGRGDGVPYGPPLLGLPLSFPFVRRSVRLASLECGGRGRWMWALAVSVAGIGAGVGVSVGGEVNGGVVEGEGPEVASDVDGEKERELSTLTPSYRRSAIAESERHSGARHW